MEIAVLDNRFASRCNEHTACAVVTNDVVAEDEISRAVKALNVVTYIDILCAFLKSEYHNILVDVLDLFDRLFCVGNERLRVDYLYAVAVSEDADTPRLMMHLADDEIALGLALDSGVHTVDVERVVELTLKRGVFNENETRTVDEMGRIGVSGVVLISVTERVEGIEVDVVAGLSQYSHTVAGMDGDVFKGDIRGILAEESTAESTRARENDNISDGRITLYAVETELVVSDVLKAHTPQKFAEGVISRVSLDLTCLAIELNRIEYREEALIVIGNELSVVSHIELRCTEHLFKLNVSVAVTDNLSLHKLSLLVFKNSVLYGNIFRIENTKWSCNAVHVDGRAAEIKLNILHTVKESEEALVSVPAVIRDVNATLKAEIGINEVRVLIKNYLYVLFRAKIGDETVKIVRVVTCFFGSL